ncbi:MAG: hypothetical protein Q4B01_10140 [Eubacteriales bacterium]|nr:hypothetical protein [Eubacteriales bacterium]
MDKYEYQAKLEEINKLVEKKQYEEAAGLADSIEWKKVRSVRTLCTVSEIYEAVGRVEDSKAILYRAYRRSPNSRQILYRLAEVCVLTQDFDDAVEYYTEYVNISPNDNNKYILKYEIYKGRGSSLEEQIAVLEEYKSKEYTEQWAYELAKLYDEAGMAEACVAECDDLALWFHNGKYVVQALELKQKYKPLTPEQQTIYDNPSEIVDMATKEEAVEKAVPTLDAEITKELPTTKKDAIADSIIMDTEKEIAAAVAETRMQKEAEAAAVQESAEQKEEAKAEEPAKTKKLGFDTVGLQNELANSMREILNGLKPVPRKEVETPQLQIPERLKKEIAETPIRETEIPKAAEQKVQSAAEAVVETVEAAAAAEAPAAVESAQTAAETAPVQAVEEPAAPVEAAEEHKALEQTQVIHTAQVEEMLKSQEVVSKETKVMPDVNQILSAPTINISDRIREEIGEKSLREYAAEQAEAARRSEEMEAKAENSLDEAEQEEEAVETETVPVPKTIAEAIPGLVKNSEDIAKTPLTVKGFEAPVQEAPAETQAVQTEQPAAVETTPAAEPAEKSAAVQQPAQTPVQRKLSVQAQNYTHDKLDDMERHMLGYWAQIRGVEEQVNAAVTRVMKNVLTDKTSTRGNIILMGDAGNGRTTLALSIARIVSRCRGFQTAKAAKIYAEDLNKKDIAATINKIAGGILIIEEAGDLTDNTIAQLAMAMDFKTEGTVVVLEDERRYLQDLLARNPQFAQKFDSTINVPMLTNDELVEFGRYYANQNGAALDNTAVMTLYDGIGAMQSPEQPVAILDVKELVDKALKHANRFGPGKMLSSISGKRYDDQDRVIIKGKDFK